MTIIREPDGRHYASFVVDVQQTPLPKIHRVSGIDLGPTDLAAVVSSDVTRENIPNPRFLKGKVRALRAQQAFSRKRKGSNNREKARRRVAVLHRKVREARLDQAHKLALRLLHEKAKQFDRKVVQTGQWQPTSQVFSLCEVKDGKKPLHVRVWDCPVCGSRLDRDYNAGVNVLVAAGLASTPKACGGDIRLRLAEADPASPLPGEEAGTRRTAAHRGRAAQELSPLGR